MEARVRHLATAHLCSSQLREREGERESREDKDELLQRVINDGVKSTKVKKSNQNGTQDF